MVALEFLCSKPGKKKASKENARQNREVRTQRSDKTEENKSWKSAASYSTDSVACVSKSPGKELEVWWSPRAAWWETKNRHPRQTAHSTDRTETLACNVMDGISGPSHFKDTNGSLITVLHGITFLFFRCGKCLSWSVCCWHYAILVLTTKPWNYMLIDHLECVLCKQFVLFVKLGPVKHWSQVSSIEYKNFKNILHYKRFMMLTIS